MTFKMAFPDFTVLPEITKAYKEGQDEQTIKNTLAKLDPNDPESMHSIGMKLFGTGTTVGMERGLAMINAAQARRETDRKLAEDAAYRAALGRVEKAAEKGAGAAPAEPAAAGPPPFPTEGKPPAFDVAPKAPSPLGGAVPPPPAPVVPPPAQSPVPAVPPPVVPPLGVKPVDFTEAPPPEDQGVPPVPPAALAAATPPPEPLGAPGQQPLPPGMPPGVGQFGQSQPPPAVAPPPGAPALPGWAAGPGVGSPALPGRLPPPAGERPLPAAGPTAAAQAEVQRLQQMLFAAGQAGPKASVLANTLLAQLRNALAKTDIPTEVRNYEFIQGQRLAMGLPREPMEQYQSKKERAQLETKEVHDYFLKYQKNYETALEAEHSLGQMTSILKNQDFISGKNAHLYGSAVSGITALTKIAQNLGVNPGDIMGRVNQWAAGPQRAAALQEEFTALSNQLIYAKLGTLGNQISEGDRKFVEMAFPSLRMTRDGNLALIKYLREALERSKATRADALEYRRAARSGKIDNENVPDMEHFLASRAEQRNLWVTPDGKLTAKGEEFKNDLIKHGGTFDPSMLSPTGPVPTPGTAPAAAPPAAPAAPAAPTPIVPGDEGRRGTYEGKKFTIKNGIMVYD